MTVEAEISCHYCFHWKNTSFEVPNTEITVPLHNRVRYCEETKMQVRVGTEICPKFVPCNQFFCNKLGKTLTFGSCDDFRAEGAPRCMNCSQFKLAISELKRRRFLTANKKPKRIMRSK